MLKYTLFMSAFAVAMAASPAEAQERRTCDWNDFECIRAAQQEQRNPQARADEPACKWNDMECIRRAQERARQEEARTDRRGDGDYDRGRDGRDGRYDRDDRRDRTDARCVERNRRGECERWERAGNGRDPYYRSSQMPKMASALAMRNGRGIPADARPWVGTGRVHVALTNRDRDRLPERAVIEVLRTGERQVWHDRNNDGRVDMIQFYRNGRLLREIRS
jgi:hypothetical protein